MTFRVGVHEEPIMREQLPKKGGGEAWTVCRFKGRRGRAWQERGGGVFEGGLIPRCTL